MLETQWHLVRTAVLAVGDPPEHVPFRMSYGPATVSAGRALRVDGKPVGTFALATVPLGAGPVPGSAYRIPEAERKQAETALEVACRLMALDRGQIHRVVSPSPSLGLHCPDEDLLSTLDGAVVDLPWPRFPTVGIGTTGLLEREGGLALLVDRIDGLVMLTEALNAASPLGEYTQYWRLFERAFHEGFREAAPLMVEFLSAGPHGMTEEEIAQWVDKRSPAIHANRAGGFTLDADVLMLVGRMREAAYDVLLNKEAWWRKDAMRRNAWQPGAGSASASGDVFGVAGRAWNLETRVTDPFGSFPLLMAGGDFDSLVPRGLWLDADANGAGLRHRGSGALDLN